jgi:hypothetical protein
MALFISGFYGLMGIIYQAIYLIGSANKTPRTLTQWMDLTFFLL